MKDMTDKAREMELFKSELAMLLKKWDVEITIEQKSMYSAPKHEAYIQYCLFPLPSHLSHETLTGSAGQNNEV